jgi:hypothetical protein
LQANVVSEWRKVDFPTAFALVQGVAVGGFGLFCIVAILLGY